VFSLVAPHLRGLGGRPVTIDDLVAKKYRKGTPEKREVGQLVAKQALTVAIDAFRGAGSSTQGTREGKGKPRAVHGSVIFQALARSWSPTFRDTPGATLLRKKATTITQARKELLEAGVDAQRIWLVAKQGVPGLYTMRRLSGKGRSSGFMVTPIVSPLAQTYDEILAWEHEHGTYPGPRDRLRVLPAGNPTPPVETYREIIAETEYDVMHVGDRTRAVLSEMSKVELFLNVPLMRELTRDLEEQYAAHPWQATAQAWKDAHPWYNPQIEAHREQLAAFYAQNQALVNDYRSLEGRYRQMASELREVLKYQAEFEPDGDARIRTGWFVGRNRRLYPTHFWITSSSSKENDPIDLGGTWDLFESLRNSNRGLLFRTHASGLDEENGRETDESGRRFAHASVEKRPLRGVDMRSSIFQMWAIFAAHRDVERMLSRPDFDVKDQAVTELLSMEDLFPSAARDARRPELRDRIRRQMKNSVSILNHRPYGERDFPTLQKLKEDPEATGECWQRFSNIQELLIRLRDYDALGLIPQMEEEHYGLAMAIVDGAMARKLYEGITLADPFDGQLYTLNRPPWKYEQLGYDRMPLTIRAPQGKKNAHGQYPVNFAGRRKPLRNLIAPLLIHSLDSAYARHVAEKLVAAGVRDFVVIFDCFLVPWDAMSELRKALDDAVEPWYRGLPVFYDSILLYLAGTPYEAEVLGWKQTCEQRIEAVDAGDDHFPVLNFKEETTVKIEAKSTGLRAIMEGTVAIPAGTPTTATTETPVVTTMGV
jgi:hypothetical protein